MTGLWLRARILVADLIVDVATVAAWLGLCALAASLCRHRAAGSRVKASVRHQSQTSEGASASAGALSNRAARKARAQCLCVW